MNIKTLSTMLRDLAAKCEAIDSDTSLSFDDKLTKIATAAQALNDYTTL